MKGPARIARCYLLILVAIVTGLVPLVLTSKLPLPAFIHSSFAVLLVLLLINLGICYWLRLGNALRSYWSVRKMTYLPASVVVGAIIGCTPSLLMLALGKVDSESVKMGMHFSLWSAFTTLTIVICEELWCRGLFLNYCNRYMSPLHLSIVIGLLFMLLHFLNPEIDMLQSGPTLFLAGAFLTLAYLHFKTIWVPIGIHYGNNYLGHLLDTPGTKDIFWGEDGYVTAAILLVCFIMLLVWSRRSNRPLPTK